MVRLWCFNRYLMQKIKSFIFEISVEILIFFSALYALSYIDWMSILHLRPTIIQDKAQEWLWKTIELQIDKASDQVLTCPIDTIVTSICQANNIDRSKIDITLSRNREVNAFATFGGHIVVNTGLIHDVRNESELAGVLGHEIAHIQCGHLEDGLQVQLLITAFAIAIDGGAKSSGLANVISQTLHNAFSRQLETEADEKSVEYLDNMKVDGHAIADFLDRMDSYGIMEYLSDHPDCKKRAKHIRKIKLKSHSPYRQLLNQRTWNKMKDL